MNSISSLNVNQQIASGMKLPGGAKASDDSFKNFLLESIGHVNNMQQQADASVEALFTGEDVNPAEVLTAVQKADLTFKMMMQVRNKLVEVYHQVQDIRI